MRGTCSEPRVERGVEGVGCQQNEHLKIFSKNLDFRGCRQAATSPGNYSGCLPLKVQYWTIPTFYESFLDLRLLGAEVGLWENVKQVDVMTRGMMTVAEEQGHQTGRESKHETQVFWSPYK